MTNGDMTAPKGRLSLTVNADHAGTRLDKWLSENAAGLTRTRIKALIAAGALTRGGAPFADGSWKVKAGETYAIDIPAAAPAEPKAEPIPLDVRYEDDDLIVINKPAGLVVHPGAGNWTGTLVNALIAHCGASLSGVGGVMRPGIVHRLDKDTSGLIVAAKNDAAHQGLSAAFSVHDIERVYSAIALGCPRPAVGTIDAALARAADRLTMTVVDEESGRPDMRAAVTHYRVIEIYGRGRAKLAGDALAALIDCTLETGRTHQIRVHLASIGPPSFPTLFPELLVGNRDPGKVPIQGLILRGGGNRIGGEPELPPEPGPLGRLGTPESADEALLIGEVSQQTEEVVVIGYHPTARERHQGLQPSGAGPLPNLDREFAKWWRGGGEPNHPALDASTTVEPNHVPQHHTVPVVPHHHRQCRWPRIVVPLDVQVEGVVTAVGDRPAGIQYGLE